MSKSLGNSLTIRDALKKYNYEVIKYVMFLKHYTSDIDLLDNDYTLAERHLYYFYNTLSKIEELLTENKVENVDNFLLDDISSEIKTKFIEAMDDDFNTTVALSELYSIFKYLNNIIKSMNKGNKEQTINTLNRILTNLKEVYGILGLFEQIPSEFISELKNKYIKELDITETEIVEKINKRLEAKKNKDFKIADDIRNELNEKGIILNDNKEGTTWDLKGLYTIE